MAKELQRIILEGNSAKKYGDEKKLLESLFSRAKIYHSKKMYHETLTALKDFISLADSSKDSRLWEACRYKAEAHTDFLRSELTREERNHHFHNALNAAGQYHDIVLKNKDECEIQRALVTLGNIYLENAPRVKDEDKSGCIQEAEKHYQKALESIPVTVSSHEKIEMTLDCHYNLAQLASLAGNTKETLARADEGLRIANKHTTYYRSKLNLQLTKIEHLIQKEKFSMAESLFPLYKQTLEKFRTEHDFHEFESEATTINAKIQVGLDRFNEAYRICKSLNRRKRSHNFNIIAKCIKKLKKWKEELEDLSISREKKHEIWDCIGDMYDCDGVFNFKHKAILAYQHSLKYCDDQEKKSDLYLSLAILHEQRCEYPQSLQCFQKGSGLSSDPKLFDIGALRVSLYFNSRKIDANLLKAALNSISDTKLKNKLATITEHDIKEDVIADLKKPNYYPNDVELPDISDCSSDDEEDTNNATTKFRRKVTKENQYGESQLQQLVKDPGHTDEEIELLIKEGSNVNHADKSGYRPLHDAALSNCSNYVKILLKHKANVNVASNDGATPLMDACFMGNIEMIENLLNANANINMADKTNWTALDYLENYIIRNSKYRDPEEKVKLTQIKHKMLTQMDKFLKKSGVLKEKIGILLKNIGDEDSIDDVIQDNFIEDDPNLFLPSKKSTTNTSSGCGSSTLVERMNTSRDPFSESRDQFQKRSKLSRKNLVKSKMKENNIPENWGTKATMMASVSKKRRPSTPEKNDFTENYGEDSGSPLPKSFRKKSKNFFLDDYDASPNKVNDNMDQNNLDNVHNDIVINANAAAEDNNFVPVTHQSLTTLPLIRSNENILNFTVKIEDKSLCVLIDKESTVKELAEEASKRYFQLYDKRPKLNLKTLPANSDLIPSDKCSIIYSHCGQTMGSIVESWNVLPCDQAYIEYCEKDEDIAHHDIKQRLSDVQLSGVVSLDSIGLANPLVLKPVIKSLKYQSNINNLILSNCQLHRHSELFKMVCSTLPSLENLLELDLSNNGLAPSHVADLSEVLTGVKRLRILNLSLNFLTDLSEKQVSHIISNLADLRELKMRSCFITGEFFESMTSTQRLERLDVSFNRLGITGIEKLALCLQKSHYLKSLDLSGCVKAKHNHCATDSNRLLKSLEGILFRDESSLESIGFRLNELSIEAKTSLLKITTILQI